MACCRLCQKTTDDGVSMIGWVENGEMVNECSECHGIVGPLALDKTEELLYREHSSNPKTLRKMLDSHRKQSSELRRKFKVDTIHKYIK